MSQYKITKQRLAEIIKEEYEAIMSQELEEGYMDKYDRAHEEEERERRRQSRRIDQERERNRRSGGYRSPGAGSGMGGIGGGGLGKKRFAGFNRKDEEDLENPDKADLDDDGKLSGYEKKRGKAIEKSMKKSKKVKEESLDSLRDLIQQQLKKL